MADLERDKAKAAQRALKLPNALKRSPNTANPHGWPGPGVGLYANLPA